jgi:hypothetical protein
MTTHAELLTMLKRANFYLRASHPDWVRNDDVLLRDIAKVIESAEKAAEGSWRLGKKIPINVYEGDRPVCQCHTVVDARRIVDSANAVRP